MWPTLAGLLLGFGIGAACRRFDLPLPAPHTWLGALLVQAMTAGYVLTDLWLR